MERKAWEEMIRIEETTPADKNSFYVYHDEKFSEYINNEVCYTTGVEYNIIIIASDEEIQEKKFDDYSKFIRANCDLWQRIESEVDYCESYYSNVVVTKKSIEECTDVCNNLNLKEDKNIKDIVWGLRDDYNMYYYAWKDGEVKEDQNEEDGDDVDWYVIVTANRQEIEEDKLPGPFDVDHEGFYDLYDADSCEDYVIFTKTPLDKIKKIAKDRGYIEDKRIRDIGWG